MAFIIFVRKKLKKKQPQKYLRKTQIDFSLEEFMFQNVAHRLTLHKTGVIPT